MHPKIIKGPKGICEDIDLDFFNKLGITLNRAITDDKNITKGIEIHPNQKPIADRSFASPKPMPSFFLICL